MRLQARVNLETLRRDLKEFQALKQDSAKLTDLQQAISKLEVEITRLEDSLSSTGSVKTADSVEEELNELRMQM